MEENSRAAPHGGPTGPLAGKPGSAARARVLPVVVRGDAETRERPRKLLLTAPVSVQTNGTAWEQEDHDFDHAKTACHERLPTADSVPGRQHRRQVPGGISCPWSASTQSGDSRRRESPACRQAERAVSTQFSKHDLLD